jgi:uncharacterized protein (TIRG00374 family)
MKKVLSALITVAIFVVILLNIDIQQLGYYFLRMNVLYFLAGLSLFIPVSVLTGSRWKFLIRNECRIGLWESVGHLLACGSFNVVTPSKLGDFARVYFLKRQKRMTIKKGASAVIFEKSTDLLSICLFTVAGVFFIGLGELTATVLGISLAVIAVIILFYSINFPRWGFFRRLCGWTLKGKEFGKVFEEAYDYLAALKKEKRNFAYAIGYSLLIWVIQFVQIYLFFLCLNFNPGPALVFGLVPTAILVGLIPITVGGMGTRDSALIVLFSMYAPASLMLGVGILMSVRYWVPALAGLPFAKKYLG